MFDAGEGDQVGVHPGFLEFRYSCFRRLETYDGVFTGMNGPFWNFAAQRITAKSFGMDFFLDIPIGDRVIIHPGARVGY